ncbi:MAG: hypothetical protein ABI231_01695 [Candidatus Tumulicola sp.]
MKLWLGAGVAIAAGALVTSIAPTRATTPDRAPVIAAAYGRNDALMSYTFQMDIAMAMRHFPWLHFRMQGLGDYRRGDRYVVHLTNAPPFASKVHDIDLSMIDPSMWPSHYRYEQIGIQDGDTLFALQGLQDASLKSATVALNPVSGAHWADATYSDGMHVHMIVSSNDVDGFLLPASLTAEVDYPHMPLSADASFTNYSITAPAP